MDYFNAFWVGGIICALVQILMEKTKLGSLTVYLLLLHKCNSILSLILAGFPAFFFVKFLKYFCSYF